MALGKRKTHRKPSANEAAFEKNEVLRRMAFEDLADCLQTCLDLGVCVDFNPKGEGDLVAIGSVDVCEVGGGDLCIFLNEA